MFSKSTQKFKQLTFIHFIFIMPILFSCSRDTEDRSRIDNKNLNNNTSTFIYNVIPENNNTAISSEYSIAINNLPLKLNVKFFYKEEK